MLSDFYFQTPVALVHADYPIALSKTEQSQDSNFLWLHLALVQLADVPYFI